MTGGRSTHDPDVPSTDAAHIQSNNSATGTSSPITNRAVETLVRRGWTTVLDDGQVALTPTGLHGVTQLIRANHVGPASVNYVTGSVGATPADPLTRQERRVAGLIAGGMTSREVAALLSLSPRTVDNHVAHILPKLQLRSRQQLVLAVARNPTIVTPCGPAELGEGASDHPT